MRKHFNCVNITWILASILPNIIDCYLGPTPQQTCVIKQITQMDASSPGQSKPTSVPEAARPAIRSIHTRMQKYFNWAWYECKSISIEHANAIQWSTRMQKHFNFNGHVNAKTFQFQWARECKSISIEHANARHWARECISLSTRTHLNWVRECQEFQLGFVLRQEHDMLFRVQPGAISCNVKPM